MVRMEQEVKIGWDNKQGTKAVKGYRANVFFIHRDIQKNKCWTLTHRGTGLAVRRLLAKRRDAEMLAVLLIQKYGSLWNFNTPADMPAELMGAPDLIRDFISKVTK